MTARRVAEPAHRRAGRATLRLIRRVARSGAITAGQGAVELAYRDPTCERARGRHHNMARAHWLPNVRPRLSGPSPRRLSDGRSASWTTTCDRDIRTCRRFHGQSGVVRSRAR
jgi:hypothetical protein